MAQLACILARQEYEILDQRISSSAKRVFIPVRWPESEFPCFATLVEVPVNEFAWWFPDESPRFRTHLTPLGDYRIDFGAEVIRVTIHPDLSDSQPFAHFTWDDMVEVETGCWDEASPVFQQHIADLKEVVRELGQYTEQMHYSRKLIAEMRDHPNPPSWFVRHGFGKSKTKRQQQGEPTDAKQSFSELKEALGLDGEPLARVTRRPRYDDDPPGPSLFRTEVSDRQADGVRLPGLYIGLSEVSRVIFARAKLYRSTFNWTDFANVDFSRCDLHDSDLRACNFEGCKFAGTNLCDCDLRGSGFPECDFADAKLDRAILLNSQRDEIGLTVEQQSVVSWTDDYEDPEGG